MIGLIHSIGRDDPGQENFRYSETSRPALKSTQCSEWVSGALCPGVKQPGYEANSGPNEYQS